MEAFELDFEGRIGVFHIERYWLEQSHGGMKIHGIFLCLFGVGHKKLFLIQKDHLDLKDSESLVKKKNQKLNMFLSQKTPA